ncbi:MAG: AAA family ATPase [Deltaproteobacteria bacterium]|nr:AAA family ATPase [Deltaproteobacteria bacterium]
MSESAKKERNMGFYLNPDNRSFQDILASTAHVDRSGVISLLNARIGRRDEKYLCVSRARNFGKTWTVFMLKAYYSRGCDSRALFEKMAVADDPSFAEHLNAHDVVHVRMTDVHSVSSGDIEISLKRLTEHLVEEITEQYPEAQLRSNDSLCDAFRRLGDKTGRQIIFIIDEWDHVIRNCSNKTTQKRYLDFLDCLFRDQSYVGLCYLTGILPLRKRIDQADPDFFAESSMVNPGDFAPFVGFTEPEVRALCEKFDMDHEMAKSRYGGYQYENVGAAFCPSSSSSAMRNRRYDNFWIKTDSFIAINKLMKKNFDGLGNDAVKLLAGESAELNVKSFQNDLKAVASRDDALTALIHLGYLGFIPTGNSVGQAFIPNLEMAAQYEKPSETFHMPNVWNMVVLSQLLLERTWRLDGHFVARRLDIVLDEGVKVLAYDDANSMAALLATAYYAAKDYYLAVQEVPSSERSVNAVFLPKCDFFEKPTLLFELMWDASARTALDNLKRSRYRRHLQGGDGELLLVGIGYDAEAERHECVIECA